MDAPAPAPRLPDLVLARLHLRLGSLALARAELETLAGRDSLDADGLVDLAEARWRTGDIAGAGEAAVAALTDEEGPLLALVVAAEAAAARGRPTEARRLAEKAMADANGTIDAIFAGMPRGSAWPADPSAPPPAPTTMFDAPSVGRIVGRPGSRRRPPPPTVVGLPFQSPAETTPSDAADAGTDGLWPEERATAPDDDGSITVTPDGLSALMAAEAEAAAEVGLADTSDEPDPADELDRGRSDLETGRPGPGRGPLRAGPAPVALARPGGPRSRRRPAGARAGHRARGRLPARRSRDRCTAGLQRCRPIARRRRPDRVFHVLYAVPPR